MKYSVGIVKQSGEITGRAFETKSEAEEYILSLMEKEQLKQARIRNLDTGEVDIII